MRGPSVADILEVMGRRCITAVGLSVVAWGFIAPPVLAQTSSPMTYPRTVPQPPPAAPPIQLTEPAPPPAATARSRWFRPDVLLIPRLGVGLYGDGELTFTGSCDGECPVAVVDGQVTTPDRTRASVGLELLHGSRGPLRFGAGFHYLPNVRLRADAFGDPASDDERPLGAVLQIPLVLEAVVPATTRFAAAVRGQFGPSFLFPGGALLRDRKAYSEYCREHEGLDECRVNRVFRSSWTYGGGAGGLFAVSDDTTLRGDLLLELVRTRLFDFEASDPGFSVEQRYRYQGFRLWLSFGVEVP